jgi:hypothetical protein
MENREFSFNDGLGLLQENARFMSEDISSRTKGVFWLNLPVSGLYPDPQQQLAVAHSRIHRSQHSV